MNGNITNQLKERCVRSSGGAPHRTVSRYASFSDRQNGHILTLTKGLMQDRSIEEVTERLKMG